MSAKGLAKKSVAALKSQFLASLRLRMGPAYDVGVTPVGWRRIRVLSGGSLLGPRIRAEVLPSGLDAFLRRGDDVMQTDARITVRTDDDELIYVSYQGLRHGSPEVMGRIERGEPVAADVYYLRSMLRFETASRRYEWLNRIVSVGVGRREGDEVVYDIHEIL